MATDKKRVFLEDLSEEQRAELARQALESQKKITPEDLGLKEFKPRLPSKGESGNQSSNVDQKTAEAIAKAPEGHVDPVLLAIPDAEAGGSVRSRRLLEALVNGDDVDPDSLNRLVIGDQQKE